jgi:hypothetical protein
MAVVLLLLGVGVYYVLGKNKNQSADVTKNASVITPTPKEAFASLQEALSKSLSLRCDYTDEVGKKVIAYIKAGTIRADIASSGPMGNSSVIVKDEKMYFWTGPQGFVMAFNMGEMMSSTSAQPSGMQKQGMPQLPVGSMQDIEKYKQYCKVATVDDKLFILPTDVKFTDMSKMIPNSMMAPPSAIPSGMNPDQTKMMQQQMMQKPQTTP